MATSILDSTKKILGIEEDNTAFDVDLMMHINSVMSILNQIGIGPDAGFMIEDNVATWEDFLGDDPRLNMVKIYVYLRVRILFDPPSGSYHLVTSMDEHIKEIEWRLNAKREGESWTPPAPSPVNAEVVEEVIIVPVQDAWAGGAEA